MAARAGHCARGIGALGAHAEAVPLERHADARAGGRVVVGDED